MNTSIHAIAAAAALFTIPALSPAFAAGDLPGRNQPAATMAYQASVTTEAETAAPRAEVRDVTARNNDLPGRNRPAGGRGAVHYRNVPASPAPAAAMAEDLTDMNEDVPGRRQPS